MVVIAVNPAVVATSLKSATGGPALGCTCGDGCVAPICARRRPAREATAPIPVSRRKASLRDKVMHCTARQKPDCTSSSRNSILFRSHRGATEQGGRWHFAGLSILLRGIRLVVLLLQSSQPTVPLCSLSGITHLHVGAGEQVIGIVEIGIHLNRKFQFANRVFLAVCLRI